MNSPIAKVAAKPPLPARVGVALVEGQKDLCQIWVRIIDSFDGFQCVCTCGSGEDAVAAIPSTRPDLILIDIGLPWMSGIECTRRLKVLLPTTPIVILTVLDDDDWVFRALEVGADGYLLKRSKPADVQAALLDVLAGGAPMSSAVARRVVRALHRHQAGARPRDNARLSACQMEVLRLLSRGLSDKEIAEQLGLGIDTVRGHQRTIYQEFHLQCRTEAVVDYNGVVPGATV